MRDFSTDLDGFRATRAIVDLDAISGNVRTLRSMLPATTKLMAVVKADGYGHGAPWIAAAAVEAGAASVGVATVSEGEELRRHGIDSPIVLLGSIDPAEALSACRAGLEITVADDLLLDAVQRAVRTISPRTTTAVHLKIDTGLRRYGILPAEAASLAVRIANDAHLRFAGVFTHLASADEPNEPFTIEQLRQFESTVASICDAGVTCPPLHAANSAGILTSQGTGYDIVRSGIALYGVAPSPGVPFPPSMQCALRIESRITRIVPIQAGDSVGYNRTFRAQDSMRGALIPIGYADGYRRSLSGRGWVGIDGCRARVLGRVSMDQMVVEIPTGARAQAGDYVSILGGEPESGAPSVENIAKLAATNSYEILVGIRRRVPRIFLRDGIVVGVRSAGRD